MNSKDFLDGLYTLAFGLKEDGDYYSLQELHDELWKRSDAYFKLLWEIEEKENEYK
jgi:hypothetical protein